MGIIKKESEANVSQEEYQTTFQRFLHYLKEFLAAKGSKTNEFFLSQSTDEKEKEAILDGCQDIDNYYSEMNQCSVSEKSVSDYLVERLEQIEREDGNSSITKEEIKSAVNEFLDKQAEEESSHIFDINSNS